jgi:hypothetical protein
MGGGNTACGLLGCDLVGGQGNVDQILGGIGPLIRFGLSSVFAVIIILGVYMTIRAAVNIIRSEGDPGKMEEGYKILKGIWIGVGLIFVGIIGIVVILAFFQAGDITDVNPIIPPGVTLPTN